jgi:hypothetical protein
MSYEVTISSYGGNSTVMAKSLVMAVRNVAQTRYSSFQPRTRPAAQYFARKPPLFGEITIEYG